MSSVSRGASDGLASRIFGFGLGGGGGGGGGARLGAGAVSLAGSRVDFLALRLRGITATSSEAPQSFAPRLRRKSSASSGDPTGPFESMPKTALPVASVIPTFPNR